MYGTTNHTPSPTLLGPSRERRRRLRNARREELISRPRHIANLAEEVARASTGLHERCQLLRLIAACDDVLVRLLNGEAAR